MTDISDPSALSADAEAPRVEQETAAKRTLRAFRSAPLTAWFGMIVIAVYIIVALFAPFFAPYGEREIVGDQFELRSAEFLLGTDNLGRDLLSRLIYAARNTVGIALMTTFLAFSLGGILGMLAATLGGWVDQIISRIVDVLMSIPYIIFALLFLTVANTWIGQMDDPSPWLYTLALILIMAVLDSTRVYRLTRAVAMNIVVMDYVEAARLRGEGLLHIIRKEILPNAVAPLIAEFGLRFCFVFLSISALSFLGLGIQPPTADWGSMVKDNATLVSFGEIIPLYPACAIALLTVAVNFVVDWMLHRSSGLKE